MDVLDRADLPFPHSLPEFQRLFPDDAACAAYLEKARWGDGFACPHCGTAGEPFHFENRPGVLRCRKCRQNTGLAGLPRISDGQLLFLQRDDETGSCIGIVMNGSPLFTGGANSGESEIRRWMLENDWIEAIVALPTDLFYNTGIQTYVWLLTNRKPAARRGKVQLIDASGERFWKSMRKSLGSKRREIPEVARKEIIRIYADILNGSGECGEFSETFDTTDFGYREVRVERPLRLNFQAPPERIERVKAAKAFRKLDADAQAAILETLGSRLPRTVFTSREQFDMALTAALKPNNIKIGAPVRKAILTALSEQDEGAEVPTRTAGRSPIPICAIMSWCR